MPAVDAVAHIIRTDGCDKAGAMRQIEAAVRDGVLRWVKEGRNRWDWNAALFRADILNLWPPGLNKQLAGQVRWSCCLRRDFSRQRPPWSNYRAANWHSQSMPDFLELRPLPKLIAELGIRPGKQSSFANNTAYRPMRLRRRLAKPTMRLRQQHQPGWPKAGWQPFWKQPMRKEYMRRSYCLTGHTGSAQKER
jgi:hypothetical protein